MTRRLHVFPVLMRNKAKSLAQRGLNWQAGAQQQQNHKIKRLSTRLVLALGMKRKLSVAQPFLSRVFVSPHKVPHKAAALQNERAKECWGAGWVRGRVVGEERKRKVDASSFSCSSSLSPSSPPYPATFFFSKPDSPQTPRCYSSTAFPGLWKINVLCTANSS